MKFFVPIVALGLAVALGLTAAACSTEAPESRAKVAATSTSTSTSKAAPTSVVGTLIIDTAAGPVPAAKATAYLENWIATPLPTASDAGAFSIEVPDAAFDGKPGAGLAATDINGTWGATIMLDGNFYAVRQPISLHHGNKHDLGEVKMLPAARITGTAQFSGLPAHGGIEVALVGTPFKAKTDGAGNYAIDGVPEGAYTLNATRSGYRAASASVTTKPPEAVVAPAISMKSDK